MISSLDRLAFSTGLSGYVIKDALTAGFCQLIQLQAEVLIAQEGKSDRHVATTYEKLGKTDLSKKDQEKANDWTLV